jgi:branched-chain amino acid aminotransferase
MGLQVEERPVPIDEIQKRAEDGSLKEMFAVGTAAVVTAMGSLLIEGEGEVVIGDGGVGEISRALYDKITGIQYGREPDPYGWVYTVAAKQHQR